MSGWAMKCPCCGYFCWPVEGSVVVYRCSVCQLRFYASYAVYSHVPLNPVSRLMRWFSAWFRFRFRVGLYRQGFRNVKKVRKGN